MKVDDKSQCTDLRPRVVAIGTFDGVHRGHRSVLKVLKDYSAEFDMEPLVITFRKHPLATIEPARTPVELTPLNKKEKLLKETGVNLLVLDFDEEMRSTTAAQWMQHLYENLNVRALVIGYDNTFGCDGINYSLEDYKIMGEGLGIKVLTAEEVREVSSSSIRKAVVGGDVEKAHEMLGRPYSISGIVTEGNRLGHTIGFPTANLLPEAGVALPKAGVYSAFVKVLEDGSKYPSMVNIGTRPTIMRGDANVIEAHLIDWKGDLYSKEISIQFLHRMRDEKKFESIEALREQLAKDREQIRKTL